MLVCLNLSRRAFLINFDCNTTVIIVRLVPSAARFTSEVYLFGFEYRHNPGRVHVNRFTLSMQSVTKANGKFLPRIHHPTFRGDKRSPGFRNKLARAFTLGMYLITYRTPIFHSYYRFLHSVLPSPLYLRTAGRQQLLEVESLPARFFRAYHPRLRRL